MTMVSGPDLAKAGYEAYGECVGWKNYAGDPMPAWEDLTEPQRVAWVQAALVIRQKDTGYFESRVQL